MIDLRCGDCLKRMKEMEDNTVDFILTDPPYELGFMGKAWDGTGIAFSVDMWREAFRVLKPGGYLMAFGGSRTYHRMAVAIEDAGFTIKDCPVWINGEGFPKSLDISKALDKKLGAEREVIGERVSVDGRLGSSRQKNSFKVFNDDSIKDYTPNHLITAPSSDIAKQYAGYKTQLKPAVEFITLAIKPLSEKNFAENVMKWGTGGLNIDGCRIKTTENLGRKNKTDKGMFGIGVGYSNYANVPIEEQGRYPANLIIHENIAPLLDSQSGILKSRASRFFKNIEEDKDYIPFIYHSKSSKKDRNMNVNGEQITGKEKGAKYYLNSTHRADGSEIKPFKNVNNHATVKPLGLLKYLLTLCLPPYDAVVLDMFGGSGSTGVALEQLNKETGYNHKCILVEKEEEHCEIIKKRCCL